MIEKRSGKTIFFCSIEPRPLQRLVNAALSEEKRLIVHHCALLKNCYYERCATEIDVCNTLLDPWKHSRQAKIISDP